MEWKRTDIILIYKSGNREESLSNSSVLLINIMCKFSEKIIKVMDRILGKKYHRY